MLHELKASGKWWHYGMPGHLERPAGTLLLLDRTEDPVTPALHFCTFQAAVHDLLDVKGGKVTIDGKDVLLSDTNPLWFKYKYEHIANVIGTGDSLPTLVKQLQAQKAIPGISPQESKLIQEQVDNVNVLVHVARRVLGHLTANDNALLEQIQGVEQTLVTGFDQLREKLNIKKATTAILDKLSSDDMNKTRLLLLLVATQV